MYGIGSDIGFVHDINCGIAYADVFFWGITGIGDKFQMWCQREITKNESVNTLKLSVCLVVFLYYYA